MTLQGIALRGNRGTGVAWRGGNLRRVHILLGACAVAALGACGWQPITEDPPDSARSAQDAAPTTAPTEALEDTLAWEACDERFDCAQLPVPLDHDDPDGPTIDLAVIRLPAPPAAKRFGAVVVNPGGPGVSGVDLVRYGAVEVFPAEVRARFDIVGFDPRGVGDSAPIACDARAETLLGGNFAPAGAAEWAALARAAEAFAAGCLDRSGDLLGNMSTADVVQDLDLLRHALGETQLTYVGFSYGTRIGAEYAARYPDRVRAMVLDGAVDPSIDPVSAALDQARALEDAFDAFLSECAADRGCPLAADGEPSEIFGQVHIDVLKGALNVDGRDRPLSATEFHLVITGLLRHRDHGWPWLAMLLAAASEGDGTPFAALADITQEHESSEHDFLAALWAVNCTDASVPAADAFPTLAQVAVAEAPRFGLTTLALELPCAVWPLPPKQEPARINADGAPPLLVIGVTGDPVTPYAWSLSLAEQLDGVLVTREGARHTAFGGGNVCTDRTVSRYLIDVMLPPEGWSCG